jgi:FixJ family two-component response regulator
MIFIIDDDQSMLRALVLLFKASGLDAKAYSSAGEFLKQSHISESDCIILDLRMPGMNGFDLMKGLASQGIIVPVICVTAFDDARSRERARELGATAYFTKPVDDQALIDAVNWAIKAEKNKKTEEGANKP